MVWFLLLFIHKLISFSFCFHPYITSNPLAFEVSIAYNDVS